MDDDKRVRGSLGWEQQAVDPARQEGQNVDSNRPFPIYDELSYPEFLVRRLFQRISSQPQASSDASRKGISFRIRLSSYPLRSPPIGHPARIGFAPTAPRISEV